MDSNFACDIDTPPFNARITDFVGLFWPDSHSVEFPVTTIMPLSSASHSSSSSGPQSSRGTRAESSRSQSSARLSSQPVDISNQDNVQDQESVVPKETSLPLAPHPGSAPHLSGAFSLTSGPGYVPSSIIRTALPLLMQNRTLQPSSASGTVPNPLASTLARDSLLIYAHQIFNSFPLPGSIMNTSHGPKDLTSPDHPFNSQLLPLLQRLRFLHPGHLPTLLLLGCVYYAVGNHKESLAVNEEILRIDANFVSRINTSASICL